MTPPPPDRPSHRRPEGGASVVVQRIYGTNDEPGYRVLVDRLWPRGVSKADAALDEWLKDVAPSTELRRWYGHEPSRFVEFRRRYRSELDEPPAANAVRHLLALHHSRLVLLTATRDVERSGAIVLRDHLADLVPPQRPRPSTAP